MIIFKKIAIVGTGLIGGSLALAIKRKKLAKEVVGISRHKKNLLLAKKIGAIDCGSQDLALIKGADLVILATPVNTIMQLAPRISSLISKDCIVIDVGSTKEEITKKLDHRFKRFLGTHPLAGSEKRGICNAREDIFKDSFCVLTPLKTTNVATIAKVKRLWNSVGAKVVFLKPAEHDRILSYVSHLPHLIAFSLISSVAKDYFKLASGGLKDSTRIASSDAQLWTDIFLSNRKNLITAIGLFQKNLTQLKKAIIRKDSGSLNRILKQAKAKRDTL